MKPHKQKTIYVYAQGLCSPVLMGKLFATPSRGKEIFSFEYDHAWLKSDYACNLDPNLSLFAGPQYPNPEHSNFGIFLDSAPDRWGRVLMRRREALIAKQEQREAKTLMESDYLLGVYDAYRMGALRFKLDPEAGFLDDKRDLAAPPWARLRDLEYASLQLETDQGDCSRWLDLLMASGASLGGARPKASVIDEHGDLWIAKFPSLNDDLNIAAWEYLVYELAKLAKINIAEAQLRRFTSKHDTFLTKRFDRAGGERLYFASMMTLLSRTDGEDGASYLEMADFIIQNGSQVDEDLAELWRRIVFSVCVSNTDDHLRNHGCLLGPSGWRLSPAYDINPSETGSGLKMNINADDNSQDLELALSVAEYFRLNKAQAHKIMDEVQAAVAQWKQLAKKVFSATEISRMERAFRVVA